MLNPIARMCTEGQGTCLSVSYYSHYNSRSSTAMIPLRKIHCLPGDMFLCKSSVCWFCCIPRGRGAGGQFTSPLTIALPPEM